LKKAASAGGSSGLSCARAAVINLSSHSGSIERNTSGGIYAYRISKVCILVIFDIFHSSSNWSTVWLGDQKGSSLYKIFGGRWCWGNWTNHCL